MVEPPTAPAGSTLDFDVQPHDIIAGSSFSTPLAVHVLDASGVPLPGTLEDVTLSIADASGTLGLTGSTGVPLLNGEAVFSGLSIAGLSSSARITAQWRDLRAESEEFAIVSAPDVVELSSFESPGVDAGILLDGQLLGAYRNDSVFTTASTSAAVGAVRASDRRNEIIAFVPGYAPTAIPAPWTPGVDSVWVTSRDIVTLPVTIWVVYGPFAEADSVISADIEVTNRIYEEQHLGLRLDAEIRDVTDNPDAENFWDLPEGTNPRESGIDTVGFTPGHINVYAVRRIESGVEGSIILGRTEIGGEFVLMAPLGWGRTTFAHEIGHILGLYHVNGLEGFSDENLMRAGGSTTRHALTEGQTFRAHYDRGSALNGVFEFAPFDEVRSCRSGSNFSSPLCPVESLNIYPDSVAHQTRVDPVKAYLSWDCGQAPPVRPDVAASEWRRAFESGDLAPGDPDLAEYMRARALAAWATTDPVGAAPTVSRLAEGPEGELRRSALRILKIQAGI